MKKRPEKPLFPPTEEQLRQGKRVPVFFYRTQAGGEPVRGWLQSLSSADKKAIGADIKSR